MMRVGAVLLISLAGWLACFYALDLVIMSGQGLPVDMLMMPK